MSADKSRRWDVCRDDGAARLPLRLAEVVTPERGCSRPLVSNRKPRASRPSWRRAEARVRRVVWPGAGRPAFGTLHARQPSRTRQMAASASAGEPGTKSSSASRNPEALRLRHASMTSASTVMSSRNSNTATSGPEQCGRAVEEQRSRKVDERRAPVRDRVETQVEHRVSEQSSAGEVAVSGARRLVRSASIEQLVPNDVPAGVKNPLTCHMHDARICRRTATWSDLMGNRQHGSNLDKPAERLAESLAYLIRRSAKAAPGATSPRSRAASLFRRCRWRARGCAQTLCWSRCAPCLPGRRTSHQP